MPWIESHTVLARHRKVMELSFDLNVKVVQVLGHLHALWHTVLEQQEGGDLSKWSDAMIAQASLWDGAPADFVARLRERGWLDGHLVHDWIEYVGPYLIKKYSSGDVPLLKSIWSLHGYKYGKGNGKYSKQKASVKRVESERQVTLPNPSLPNLTKPTKKETRSADADALARFEEFWQAYPERNGKKLEKAHTLSRFLKLPVQDQALAVQAVRHYAEALKAQGLSAKDPKRFLRDGEGGEPWRDWITRAVPAPDGAKPYPPQQKCAWVNDEPCQAYTIAGSRYCAEHKDKLVKIQQRNKAMAAPTAALVDRIGRAMA